MADILKLYYATSEGTTSAVEFYPAVNLSDILPEQTSELNGCVLTTSNRSVTWAPHPTVDQVLDSVSSRAIANCVVQKSFDKVDSTIGTVTASVGELKTQVENKADRSITITRPDSTKAVGSTIQPVYVDNNGEVKPIEFTIATNIASDALLTDRYVSSVYFTSSSGAATRLAVEISGEDQKGEPAKSFNIEVPNATTSTFGAVTVGSNISVLDGSISLNATNVNGALGNTPVSKATDASSLGGEPSDNWAKKAFTEQLVATKTDQNWVRNYVETQAISFGAQYSNLVYRSSTEQGAAYITASTPDYVSIESSNSTLISIGSEGTSPWTKYVYDATSTDGILSASVESDWFYFGNKISKNVAVDLRKNISGETSEEGAFGGHSHDYRQQIYQIRLIKLTWTGSCGFIVPECYNIRDNE